MPWILFCSWTVTDCPKGCVFGRFILALQASDGIHLGADNLGVVRLVGWLLDGNAGSRPVELVKDRGSYFAYW